MQGTVRYTQVGRDEQAEDVAEIYIAHERRLRPSTSHPHLPAKSAVRYGATPSSCSLEGGKGLKIGATHSGVCAWFRNNRFLERG
jgi:hypothetical protein